MDSFTFEHNGRIFATSEARIVTQPSDLPREIASALPEEKVNDSYLWIAGRFVQAGIPNKNGHFWEIEDLEFGNKSIKHTPMNMLHQWSRPVGTFVDSQIVRRPAAASDGEVAEIQALGVVWAANFSEAASKIRDSHEKKELWFSMECVAEKKQCMDCGLTFDWAVANELACAHLQENRAAPRRLINPTFVGGALIFPPESPAWPEADIMEVAMNQTIEYADSQSVDVQSSKFSRDEWESIMGFLSV
jgi:hypothetical protein